MINFQILSYTFVNLDELYSRAQFFGIRSKDNLPLTTLVFDFTLLKKCTQKKQ